jgi:malate dehydrogenase (oxaloacetate-decarboxylating)(NADP+)
MITNDRGDELAQHKIYFSRNDNNGQQFKSLSDVVDYVKPTMLMGLSTIRGVFDESILRKMAKLNKNPIIFPLSNPSSNAECTFEEAIKFTDGRAIFASGSPFQPYLFKGNVYVPSQGKYVSLIVPSLLRYLTSAIATCMFSQVLVLQRFFASPLLLAKKW